MCFWNGTVCCLTGWQREFLHTWIGFPVTHQLWQSLRRKEEEKCFLKYLQYISRSDGNNQNASLFRVFKLQTQKCVLLIKKNGDNCFWQIMATEKQAPLTAPWVALFALAVEIVDLLLSGSWNQPYYYKMHLRLSFQFIASLWWKFCSGQQKVKI